MTEKVGERTNRRLDLFCVTYITQETGLM